MKPAVAKATEPSPLEELGQATLEIVHDLKNQLNGLKLYATYLRKRLDRDDRSREERETIAKLIAGLDRAAAEITVLVRYAHPFDLKQRARVDLRNLFESFFAGSLRMRQPQVLTKGSLGMGWRPNHFTAPLILKHSLKHFARSLSRLSPKGTR